mgnify:FL=1
MSLICIISFWNRRWWSKVGKTIFHIGVWTELLGPFKTDHSSAGEYGKNQERRRRGDVILKPAAIKKKTAPSLVEPKDPTQTRLKTIFFFFLAGTSEQQEHDMEKKSLMENAQAKSSHSSSSSSVSALKQMEQMMGRNYSDFMRSLAAKYNQTNTKE